MPRPTLVRSAFGTAPDGTPVDRWTMESGHGTRAEVLTYGAILHGLWVPDAAGRPDQVVLSLPTVADYADRSPFFGAVVGRYANRIDRGRFTLDGRTHHLPVNDRGHTLHGGPEGFHRKVWRARPGDERGGGGEGERGDGGVSLVLTLHSPDGDMGFPGALDVTVTYTLRPSGTLRVDYGARTDRPTVINLSHHAYFNLAGAGSGDVLGHTLAVDSDSYLPVTPGAIPLGPPAPTAGTPFDLAEPRPIGDGIDADHPQLRAAGGYDHCWILNSPTGTGELRRAARLADEDSGRRLEVWTSEPGLQVYTGNTLDGSLSGADGKPYERYGAVCLETQHFPDSPNHAGYPSTVLRPGRDFRSGTEFRFPRAE